jgi:hypothetical protein
LQAIDEHSQFQATVGKSSASGRKALQTIEELCYQLKSSANLRKTLSATVIDLMTF